MDFSFKNCLNHLINLWKGEVTFKRRLTSKQGNYVLNNDSVKIVDVNNSDECLEEQPDRKLDTRSVEHYRLERKMSSIVDTYQHERHENLDEYLKAVGVPHLLRKMKMMYRPRLGNIE